MFSVKNTIGLFTIAYSTLTTGSSCTNVYKRAEQYMQDKPQTEFNEVVSNGNGNFTNGYFSPYIATQSKLDSVAYRDVFESTQGIKDSSKVAEFNKIAQQNRGENLSEVSRKLANNTKVKDYNKIINDSRKYNKVGYFAEEYIQHKTDSLAYRKFFETHNLLDSKTLKMFNKVSKQIKP